MKSAINNETKVTLNLSSSVVGDSNDENNFPHKLLSNNTQVLKLRKAFTSNYSVQKLSYKKLYNLEDFWEDP